MKKSLVQKLRIPVSILIGSVFFSLSMLSESLWKDSNSMFGGIFFFLGIVLMGIGTFGRLWCMMYIAGYKSKMLVTEGPYSLLRNPLYFFSLVGFVGVGLCTETLSMPLLLALAFFCYYPWVINNEEKKLRMLYGEQFEAYAKKTPRFFPRISNFHEPDTYVINPKTFLRHMSDTMLFPIILGALEIVEHLHAANILPCYLALY